MQMDWRMESGRKHTLGAMIGRSESREMRGIVKGGACLRNLLGLKDATIKLLRRQYCV